MRLAVIDLLASKTTANGRTKERPPSLSWHSKTVTEVEGGLRVTPRNFGNENAVSLEEQLQVKRLSKAIPELEINSNGQLKSFRAAVDLLEGAFGSETERAKLTPLLANMEPWIHYSWNVLVGSWVGKSLERRRPVSAPIRGASGTAELTYEGETSCPGIIS